MPRSLTVAVLLHFLLLPALLLADDFSAFRIPRHQVLTARASAMGAYSGSANHYGTPMQGYADYQSDLQGELRAYGSWLSDSDPLRLELELIGAFTGRRNLNRHSSFQNANDQSQYSLYRQKSLLENYQLNASSRVYPWAVPLGLELSTRVSGNDNQAWSTQYQRSTNMDQSTRQYDNTESWNFSYYASGSAALGLGRVRDATAVYDVYALEARLQEDGILTRPLLPATRQRLVDLIYISGDYGRVHERPARFFWREVGTALNEDGGLRVEGLDAYNLYRIAEPYFARYSFSRYYSADYAAVAPVPIPRSSGSFPSYVLLSGPSRVSGWFVGPTLGASHNHSIRRSHYRNSVEQSNPDSSWISQRADYSERVSEAADNISFGVRGEYHRPFGLRWQFDATSNLTHPYDDHHNIKGESFGFSSKASLTRFILDRWLLTARVGHQRSLREERKPSGLWQSDSYWSVSTSAEVNYYLEDNLSLSFTAQQSQSRNRSPNDGRGFYRTYDVFVGLTYQLAGRLTAPGVATPTSIFD